MAYLDSSMCKGRDSIYIIETLYLEKILNIKNEFKLNHLTFNKFIFPRK